ncbi:recombination-associated protein RdgC [uncultured Paraglaciecola sp.]|uniref:recombination-associated protein RdgC n=1 Tax=uncultured Paraglaciecola sp. TaxID=1765024 RepID=UPI002624D713|nr:recombination-associated protein RdgC [uncultured Paraglaciecola sp.]
MSVFPKSLIIYTFSRDIGLTQPDTADKLEKLLAEFKFQPCGGTDKVKFGFTQPMGEESELLVHSADGNMMISVMKQTKTISPAAFNKKLRAKQKEVEEREQRPLNKREIDNLKDELLIDLLPSVLPVDKRTNAYIINNAQYLVIDAATHKAAEDFTALLRKAIGSLPVTPIECTKSAAETVMTEWVKSGEMPAGFTLGTNAVLKSVLEEGGVIRCKNQDLASDEVLKHIENDKMVVQLSLDWQERITFTIKEDLSITSMKFSDELKDQNDDIDREDKAARFDADFALAVGEINALITDFDKTFEFYRHENDMAPSQLPEPAPKEDEPEQESEEVAEGE